MSKGLKRAVFIICILLAFAAVFLALTFFKVIHPNRLFTGSYELKGVDVSSYQGEIDWQRLSEQDIDLAFIKATEGSGYTDERFESNLESRQRIKW